MPTLTVSHRAALPAEMLKREEKTKAEHQASGSNGSTPARCADGCPTTMTNKRVEHLEQQTTPLSDLNKAALVLSLALD